MIQIKNKQYEIRTADPAQDLEWAYALFKLNMNPYIVKMLGEWPEKIQYEFFSEGFYTMPIQIVMHDGVRLGCYAIFEEGPRVTVQRMYMDPTWQGSGIGSWVVDKAVKLAQAVRKPLATEVLANNEPAIKFYLHKGFRILREQPCYPIIQCVILHKDTEAYYTPDMGI
jgi:GNAT superfamily N-acetyltransferase